VKAGTIASMILVFSIAAAATGAAVFAAWAWHVEPAPLPARWWVMAAIVASVGALVLIPIGVLMDRALASLRQYIEDGTKVSTMMSGGLRWFRPITRAFVGAVDQFQQREQVLRNQLGELEIRHRVSEAERRQIEAVLHALRDGVLVTDAFNEIVMANPAAASILGFDLKTAIHKSIDVVIHDPRLRQLIRDARESGSIDDSKHVEHAIDNSPGASDSRLAGDNRMQLRQPTTRPRLAQSSAAQAARVASRPHRSSRPRHRERPRPAGRRSPPGRRTGRADPAAPTRAGLLDAAAPRATERYAPPRPEAEPFRRGRRSVRG
jgi:PAS domain-containing protein